MTNCRIVNLLVKWFNTKIELKCITTQIQQSWKRCDLPSNWVGKVDICNMKCSSYSIQSLFERHLEGLISQCCLLPRVCLRQLVQREGERYPTSNEATPIPHLKTQHQPCLDRRDYSVIYPLETFFFAETWNFQLKQSIILTRLQLHWERISSFFAHLPLSRDEITTSVSHKSQHYHAHLLPPQSPR